MRLSADLLRKVREIIAKYHLATIGRIVGPSVLNPDEVEVLRSANLLHQDLGIVKNSYLYGNALARKPNKESVDMSDAEFQAYLDSTPNALSPAEQHAVVYAEQHAAEAIRGLGNRAAEATVDMLLGEMRSELGQEDARAEVVSSLKHQESSKALAAKLGKLSKDWTRDWARVAQTELHVAHQRGIADQYRMEYSDDQLVFKRPSPDACPTCKQLFLNDSGVPKVFRLAELEANGDTNEGRPRSGYLPVIGAVHPNCSCVISAIPNGWGFDEAGTLIPGGELDVEPAEEVVERSEPVRKERLLIKSHLAWHPAEDSPMGERVVGSGVSGFNLVSRQEPAAGRSVAPQDSGGYVPDFRQLNDNASEIKVHKITLPDRHNTGVLRAKTLKLPKRPAPDRELEEEAEKNREQIEAEQKRRAEQTISNLAPGIPENSNADKLS